MRDRVSLLLGALIGLALVLVLLAGAARGQTAPDILRPWGDIRVRVSLDPTTDSIECDLAPIPGGRVAALTLETPNPAEATLPIALPGASLRCKACNEAGCSALSANAVMIDQRSRGDCNADGTVTVADFLCVNRVIFGFAP